MCNLDPKHRAQMLANITAVSREIYDHENSRTERYIHNHVPTVSVALLTCALVAEKHNSVEASKWKEKANTLLSRTMFLLSQVKDGSMNEGVGYGTYTTRSLTQYVFLAERHLGIDLTNNPWLHQHFWFMYHTILPGFRETVGIADSNFNWLYGPESQLVFLDKFVVRNAFMSNTPELNRTDCKHRRPDTAEVRLRNLLRLTGSRILAGVWEEERPWERGGPEDS